MTWLHWSWANSLDMEKTGGNKLWWGCLDFNNAKQKKKSSKQKKIFITSHIIKPQLLAPCTQACMTFQASLQLKYYLSAGGCCIFFSTFTFIYLCLPWVKCAPWGKLSSWLCSASQEYMALASLYRQEKHIKTWPGLEDENGINRVE